MQEYTKRTHKLFQTLLLGVHWLQVPTVRQNQILPISFLSKDTFSIQGRACVYIGTCSLPGEHNWLRLAWENIPNPIICVGASRSYPFLS